MDQRTRALLRVGQGWWVSVPTSGWVSALHSPAHLTPCPAWCKGALPNVCTRIPSAVLSPSWPTAWSSEQAGALGRALASMCGWGTHIRCSLPLPHPLSPQGLAAHLLTHHLLISWMSSKVPLARRRWIEGDALEAVMLGAHQTRPDSHEDAGAHFILKIGHSKIQNCEQHLCSIVMPRP